ncbi:SDR family oxidoreductase [Paraconexibacter antarcticus]|uniref:SDR family oxidoreductase n=1 Tax=Paraconexibacter antarcticus TaxID=2949664 RepID=A0ABY5DW35_9ACTN|nr:SDR family oxidoreductase [Paraconexibacter antarcticus]UTI66228.1 SDR family oxidoreductase [Paraconexibacter antarcticus]
MTSGAPRRVAVITGGTRNLGLATARRFARDGYDLVLGYHRDADTAASAQLELEALGGQVSLCGGDISTEAGLDALFDVVAARHGRLDVFVANAAATKFAPLTEIGRHHYQRTFDLSVGAFLFGAQRAATLMNGDGSIIGISGIDAARHMPRHGLLGAAKAAMEALVRSLAFDLGPRITVNAIGAGAFASDRNVIYSGDERFEGFLQDIGERSAAQRVARLDEIAGAVAFLASADARFVTGTTLTVDGGLSVGFLQGGTSW